MHEVPSHERCLVHLSPLKKTKRGKRLKIIELKTLFLVLHFRLLIQRQKRVGGQRGDDRGVQVAARVLPDADQCTPTLMKNNRTVHSHNFVFCAHALGWDITHGSSSFMRKTNTLAHTATRTQYRIGSMREWRAVCEPCIAVSSAAHMNKRLCARIHCCPASARVDARCDVRTHVRFASHFRIDAGVPVVVLFSRAAAAARISKSRNSYHLRVRKEVGKKIKETKVPKSALNYFYSATKSSIFHFKTIVYTHSSSTSLATTHIRFTVGGASNSASLTTATRL